MITLTREERDAWVEALRSGKYKQFHGGLGDWELGFCCLGVLAETNLRFAGDRTVVYDLSQKETLWKMNDGHGYQKHTFDEIANWIEENLDVVEENNLTDTRTFDN